MKILLWKIKRALSCYMMLFPQFLCNQLNMWSVGEKLHKIFSCKNILITYKADCSIRVSQSFVSFVGYYIF